MFENKVKYKDVHCRSLEWLYENGLKHLASELRPFYFEMTPENVKKISITKVYFGEDPASSGEECLVSGESLLRALKCLVEISDLKKVEEDGSIEEVNLKEMKMPLGDIPIIFKPTTMTDNIGGSFILNGNERLCRLTYSLKRNIPFRRVFKSFRGPERVHEKGILVRGNNGYTSVLNRFFITRDTNEIILHHFAFRLNVGILLYCLSPKTTDKKIFLDINPKTLSQIEHLKSTLEQCLNKKRSENMIALGKLVKTSKISSEFQEFTSEKKIAREFIRRYFLIHLKSRFEKYQFLIYVVKNLLDYHTQLTESDDMDSLEFQEVLLPSCVFMEMFKSLLLKRLDSVCRIIQQKDESKRKRMYVKIMEGRFRSFGAEVQKAVATGEVPKHALFPPCVPQYSGVFIQIERTNFVRYSSFFRAVHRGRKFVDTKLTSVRKFRNENWGFVCPVNSPDGTQCGLLNHLTSSCDVTTSLGGEEEIGKILFFLNELGEEVFLKSTPEISLVCGKVEWSLVIIDGSVVGWTKTKQSHFLENSLRKAKVEGRILKIAEIVSFSDKIEINTYDSRMIRPVINLTLNKTEWISPSEQMRLLILTPEDNIKTGFTHREIDNLQFLSNTANLTPFSNFNQSPRNVYQCQMAKQTFSFPLSPTYQYDCENSTYSLDIVQKGLSQTSSEKKDFADNCMGLNAVVAVLSYTGFDMEDAMIMNKGSFERGLFHGRLYKTERIENTGQDVVFCNCERNENDGKPLRPLTPHFDPSDDETIKFGLNGLPMVGSRLQSGDYYVSTFNSETLTYSKRKWTKEESPLIKNVVVISLGKILQIKLEFDRRPVVGDKFSSRHGQKGILSFLYPEDDMPFSESGIRPDIIINPHAFPSRMTIGMLCEMIASKQGALCGQISNATSFLYGEKYGKSFIKKYGELLSQNGFNYYGNELLYSGTKGTQFQADIYMGVCYYQRLKHMVSDKYQVRTTGIVSSKTNQPLKGRSRGGGIRFGEMERDCLLSYGSSFLVKERLFHSSDETFAIICKNCGNMFSTDMKVCLVCKNHGKLMIVEIPHVLKYLINELFVMNIKLKIS